MSGLPDHPSLEYLKKLAKERLSELRRADPRARLADAQLAVARDHGFPSWRALKLEVDRRRAPAIESFFAASHAGDLTNLRELLERDPDLVRLRHPSGATALHAAVPHSDCVRLLLELGADPNARDAGDNALPLHFAAGGGHLDSVRALLAAGSDVHGTGDAHRLDVIGWATVFAETHRDVVDVLVAHGARHHVFSAVALGDLDVLRRVVADDPAAIRRRLAPTEQEQTALHYVIAPPDGLVGGLFRTGDHYRTLDALIELGADVEALDAKGRTPLAVAMLRGDQEAMRRLYAAGARAPAVSPIPATPSATTLGASVTGVTPMLSVGNMEETVAWYGAVGFELRESHGEGGGMDWASVAFGDAEIMFVPSHAPWHRPTEGLTLWIRTSRLDDIYAILKRQQLERARAMLNGERATTPEVRFVQDLHTAFYGLREFGIRDVNGVELMFSQPVA